MIVLLSLPPKPWLGIAIRPLRNSANERVLYVERVTKGGPADKAGMRPGDIVTMVGGGSIRIGDDLDFLLFLADQMPGERLRFRVIRAGLAQDVVVLVGVMPESAKVGWERALQMARQKRINAQRQAQ